MFSSRFVVGHVRCVRSMVLAVALCVAVLGAVFVSSASALPRLECAVWYRDGETHASSTYTCNEWRVVGFEGWKQDTGFYDPYPDNTPHEGPGAGRGDTGPQRGVEQKRDEAKGEADAAVAQASTEAEDQPCSEAVNEGNPAPASQSVIGAGRSPVVRRQLGGQGVLPTGGENSAIALPSRSLRAMEAINQWGQAVMNSNLYRGANATMFATMLVKARTELIGALRAEIDHRADTDPETLGKLCRSVRAGNTAVARGLYGLIGRANVQKVVDLTWNSIPGAVIGSIDPLGGWFLSQSSIGLVVPLNLWAQGLGDPKVVVEANVNIVMDALDHYYKMATGQGPPP